MTKTEAKLVARSVLRGGTFVLTRPGDCKVRCPACGVWVVLPGPGGGQPPTRTRMVDMFATEIQGCANGDGHLNDLDRWLSTGG